MSPLTVTLRPSTAAVLVVALGAILSLLLAITVQRAERLFRDVDIRAHAAGHRLAAEHGGESAFGAVAALGALYASSTEVSPEEFDNFCSVLLAHHPEVRALEWAPLRPAAGGADSLRRPPGEPSSFELRFLVELVHPLRENEAAVGLDLGAEKLGAHAIQRAIDAGAQVPSEAVELAQEAKAGFLLFEAVYDSTKPRNTVEERRDAVVGVVLGVVEAGRLHPGSALLHGLRASLLTADGRWLAGDSPAVEGEGEYTWDQPWSFGGVPLVTRYASPSPSAAELPTSLTLGFAGLLVSALAGVSTWRARRQEADLREAARTAAWANDALAVEIKQRARAQAQLDKLNRELERRVASRTEELTKANVRLTDRDAWLRLLLEHFPGAVWSVDRNLRVAFASGARLEDLVPTRTGHSDDALQTPGPGGGRLLSRDLCRVLAPSVADVIVQAHEQAVAGATVTCEVTVGERTFELDVRPPAGHEGAAVVTVALDVTSRRRLEAERLEARLQAAQRMESLGMLAGGIAHDFNNLLAAIIGNTSLALELRQTRPELESYLRRIEVAAVRAAELTRGLLHYAGRGPEQREPTDLTALARELLLLLDASLGRRCTLRARLPNGPLMTVCDPSQLRQVLLNLVTNAADATPGGEVTLTLDRYRGPAPPDQEGWVTHPPGARAYVRVIVRDTGVGMDTDTRRRMFEPFFSTKRGGNGLGLAATLGTVQRHEGAIRVVSRPGHGTTIEVWIPAIHEAPRASLEPTLGAKVLVVDDDEAIRDLATSVLERDGYEVVAAVDGQDGLDRFLAAPQTWAVVVLDLTMPRMSGAEAFEKMRAVRPDLAVVISSGYSEVGLTDDRNGGVVLRLPKPYRARDLCVTVERAIRGIRG